MSQAQRPMTMTTAPLAPRSWRTTLAGSVLLAASLTAQAALPAEIEADRLLQEAAMEMKKENDISWPQVLAALEGAEATGTAMAQNFNYHMGRALSGNLEFEAAVLRLERYLKAQGTRARYYQEALSLLSEAKKQIAVNKRVGTWERFEWADQAKGELRDRKTGLVWQACASWDGNWNGQRCDGQRYVLSWAQAQDRARSLASRSGQGWRLPTRAELVEVAGHLPRTSPSVWTSTEKADDKAFAVHENRARTELLGERPADDPIASDYYKTQTLRLRLVR